MVQRLFCTNRFIRFLYHERTMKVSNQKWEIRMKTSFSSQYTKSVYLSDCHCHFKSTCAWENH